MGETRSPRGGGKLKGTKKELLALASYLVIEEHRRLTGQYPSGLYFNKAMCLLYRNLKKANLNLELPHCWYRYGDEV